MSEAPEKFTGKYFSTANSLIIAVFVVAASGLLFQLDAGDYRDEVRSLNTLAEFSKVPFSEDADPIPAAVYLQLQAWVAQNNPGVGEQLARTRTEFLASLDVSGISIESEDIEGKPDSSDAIPVRLLKLEPQVRQTEFPGGPSVAAVIDRLLWATAPSRVAIFVPTAKSKKIEGEYSLASATISGTNIKVVVKEQLSSRAQRNAKVIEFSVPANETEISDNGPSVMALYQPEISKSSPLLPIQDCLHLAADQAVLDRIRKLYGILPIEDARKLASTSLVEGSKSVSVLGFSISPRRLPTVVFSISLMLLSLVLTTVELARRRMIRIAAYSTENPLDTCMHSKWARWILWAAIPAASVQLANAGRFEHGWLVLAESTLLVLAGTVIGFRARDIFVDISTEWKSMKDISKNDLQEAAASAPVGAATSAPTADEHGSAS